VPRLEPPPVDLGINQAQFANFSVSDVLHCGLLGFTHKGDWRTRQALANSVGNLHQFERLGCLERQGFFAVDMFACQQTGFDHIVVGIKNR
jgi:hypothetical protein